MDSKETKTGGEGEGEEKGCCAGHGRRCCCKALAAVALLLVGGVGGWFAGRCSALKQIAPAAVTAPK
jgi:hypothetical protein